MTDGLTVSQKKAPADGQGLFLFGMFRRGARNKLLRHETRWDGSALATPHELNSCMIKCRCAIVELLRHAKVLLQFDLPILEHLRESVAAREGILLSRQSVVSKFDQLLSRHASSDSSVVAILVPLRIASV